jgi:hypothetical protein
MIMRETSVKDSRNKEFFNNRASINVGYGVVNPKAPLMGPQLDGPEGDC